MVPSLSGAGVPLRKGPGTSHWGMSNKGPATSPLEGGRDMGPVTGLLSGKNMGPVQWRIRDFAEEGAPTRRGAPIYYLTNFLRKLHENKEILAQRGARIPGPT